jgi:type II secretion system protein I
MSLLEVLIAMAILLMALVGIGRLITQSTDRAEIIREQGMAALRCQSKLAEVVAGVEPLQGQSEVAFEDDPSWSWSLLAEPRSEAANLWSVQVRVSRAQPDGSKLESVLSQLVVDPLYRGGDTTTPPSGSTNPDASQTPQTGTQAGGNQTGGNQGGGGNQAGAGGQTGGSNAGGGGQGTGGQGGFGQGAGQGGFGQGAGQGGGGRGTGGFGQGGGQGKGGGKQ